MPETYEVLSRVIGVRYEAGRNLTIAGALRRKGEPVPETAEWSTDTIQKLLRTGHIRIASCQEGVTEKVAPSSLSDEVEAKGRGRKDAPK